MRDLVLMVGVVVVVFDRSQRGGFIDCGKSFLESRDVGFSGVESHDDGFCVEVALEVFDSFLVGNVLVDFVNAALTVQVHIERYGLLFGLGKSGVAGHECGAKRQKKYISFHRCSYYSLNVSPAKYVRGMDGP